MHLMPPLVHTIAFGYHLICSAFVFPWWFHRVQIHRAGLYWFFEAVNLSFVTVSVAVMFGVADTSTLVLLFFVQCLSAHWRYHAECNPTRRNMVVGMLYMIVAWFVVAAAAARHVGVASNVTGAAFGCAIVSDAFVCALVAIEGISRGARPESTRTFGFEVAKIVGGLASKTLFTCLVMFGLLYRHAVRDS
jgi:hypothetical protein